MGPELRLNLGCGEDIRAGYVNIDAVTYRGVDIQLDVAEPEMLLAHFAEASVSHVLAQDFLEHLYHWQAVRLLAVIAKLLVPGGTVEIRCPDAEWLLNDRTLPLHTRIVYLYGGQDIPQPGDSPERVGTRRELPWTFAHRYGWTPASLSAALQSAGLTTTATKLARANFVVRAAKPAHEAP